MKINKITAAALLLGVVILVHNPAMAQVPAEEIEITTTVHEAPATGDFYTVRIKWESYDLSVVSWANSAFISYGSSTPAGELQFLNLEPSADAPRLDIARLPDDMSELLQVCIGMAIAALEKDESESAIKPGARDALALLGERQFSVNDYSSNGSLSLSWYSSYRGEGRVNNFAYRDSRARFDIEGASDACKLTLQEMPSPYSAEITLKGGKLTAKALSAGGRGLPDEAELLEFLREITSRAHGLAAGGYCGAPDDVVRMLERLSGALASAERFDSYEELEEAICPT